MSNEPRAGKGIDPETLAAYMDNRLSPEQRAVVEAQLASDPDSYAVLVDTLKALDDEAIAAVEVAEPSRETPKAPVIPIPLPVKRAPMMRWAIAGGVLAAAAALALVVWTQPDILQRLRRNGPSDPLMARMVDAIGEERYFEPRVTDNLKFGPLRSVLRGQNELSSQNVALLAVAAELQNKVKADPSAPNLRAWGVAQLHLGDLDGAILSLESALAISSDPHIAADLSAAYLVRAVTNEHPDDWPRALGAAQRATEETQSPIPAAWFNKALALEGLSLTSQAETAWRRFIEIEQDAAWRAEGARRLERLQTRPSARARQESLLDGLRDGDTGASTQLAREFPRLAREYVDDVLLPDLVAGVPDGIDRLTIIKVIADSLPGTQDDLYLKSVIHRLRPQGRTVPRSVADAFAAYGRGRNAFVSAKYGDALHHFHQVEKLSGVQNPALSASARMHAAIATYYAGQLNEAASELVILEKLSATNRWLSLQARCHWSIGIIRGAQSRFGESLAHYEHAREIYWKLGEKDHVAVMDQLIGDGYSALGDQHQTWLALRKALSYWESDWNPKRRTSALILASLAARRAGWWHTVLALQSAAVEEANNPPDPVAAAEAWADAARANAQLGRPNEAQHALLEAKESWAQVSDPGVRQRLQARIGRAEASSNALAASPEAIKVLEAAAREYETAGSSLQLAEVYLGLATALRRAGRDDDASAILRRAMVVIEGLRLTPPTNSLRISYFDSVWSVLESLIDLTLIRRQYDEAFALAEMGRARVLGQSLATSPPESLTPSAVASRLQESEAMVVYCLLPSQAVAWVLKPSSVTVHVLDRERIQRLSTLPAEIHNKSLEASNRELEEAWRQLWAPISASIGRAERVFVVADSFLSRVPFAALRDPVAKQYLVQTLVTSVLPGVRFLSDQRSVPSLAGGIVAAASPSVRGLPALGGAAREAAAVAAVYGSTPLIGPTRIDFVNAARSAHIVHFAGHAIMNADLPSLSYLAFDGIANDGALFSFEVENLRFINRPVVVLSACRTGIGADRRGEGALSLARPFIGAGASAVISTLWNIEDASTVSLLVSFHNGLSSGATAAEALASAQRAALAVNGNHHPWLWAGFSVTDRG